MANYCQVCVFIQALTSLSSVGVLFLLDCVNLVIYIKLVLDERMLTDFFLEFVACLDDFLNNSTVAVMLVLDDACLGLPPVIRHVLHDLRLDLIHTQLNVLLAALQL